MAKILFGLTSCARVSKMPIRMIKEKTVGKEIERKFLVQNDSWRDGAQGTYYKQGYLSTDPERAVRVRIAGEKAFLTIKGKSKGATRAEFEYPIPMDDADVMLDTLCAGPVIEKTRYKIPHAGYTWEVDLFYGDNDGLVVAEVELADETDEPPLPDWIGEEVTQDARYFNASLVSNPYKLWKSA